jgi:hypothetical protein
VLGECGDWSKRGSGDRNCGEEEHMNFVNGLEVLEE